jgi:hypothetical protein
MLNASRRTLAVVFGAIAVAVSVQEIFWGGSSIWSVTFFCWCGDEQCGLMLDRKMPSVRTPLMPEHTKAALLEIQNGLNAARGRHTFHESRHEEYQYLDLIQDVLDRGETRVCRLS